MGYKHGYSGTPTHKAWLGMLSRAGGKTVYGKKYYTDVKVCERWQEFENFLQDMGLKPDGYSLDRIDSTGDYEPSNCRWLPLNEQSNNRKHVKQYTYEGKTMNMKRWAEHMGIDYLTVYQRIKKLGWSFERAITTPTQKRAS